MLHSVLEELGLPGSAGDAYAQLVTMPSAAATDVARSLGLSTEVAQAALETLEHQALASRTGVGPDARWTAVPPLLTGQQLLVARAQLLVDTQRQLVALAEAHERSVRASGADDMVEIVLGAQAVHAQIRRLQDATGQILALVKPPFVAVPHEEAASRGPAHSDARVVYDQAVFTAAEGVLDSIQAGSTPSSRYRVHHAVPMRLQIYDRRVAALPLVRHDAQPAVLLVHPSGLLSLAVELFEAIWREARPLPIGGSSGPLDVDDQRVLALLLGGLTDESIAHQLDRSLRWVQRRVRLLMDAAGVRTRLQLGWEAHRRQWLDEPPPINQT